MRRGEFCAGEVVDEEDNPDQLSCWVSFLCISNTEKINIRNIFFFYTVDSLKENLRFLDQRKPHDMVIFLKLWKVIRIKVKEWKQIFVKSHDYERDEKC